MAAIIHVSPERLLQAASAFEQTSGEVKTLTSSMTGTVESLSGRIWSGEAAAAYKAKFASLHGDITRLHKMITVHASHLRMIAKEYTAAENESTAQAGHLSGSIL